MVETSRFYIYDEEYELRATTEGGAERIARVVELVNCRMKEIELKCERMCFSTKKIAVLTALNLADEYIEIQEELLSDQVLNEKTQEDYDARIPVYIERIESFLEKKER